MSVIAYPSTSVYATTPQLSWRLGIYKHRPIAPAKGDTKITISAKYNNRPDKLSLDLYGTPDYMFVFMLRNMNVIRDPIFGMKAGITIMVPSLDTLRTVFG